MTKDEFQQAKIGHKAYVKMEWNGQVLMEGAGLIIDKAVDDSTHADLKITSKYKNGTEFWGWFPREMCTLLVSDRKAELAQEINKVLEKYEVG